MREAALITAFALIASTLPLGYALRHWWQRRQALEKIMVLPSSDLAERQNANWYVAQPQPGIPGFAILGSLMRWMRSHPAFALTTAAVVLTVPFVAASLAGDTPAPRDAGVADPPEAGPGTTADDAQSPVDP